MATPGEPDPRRGPRRGSPRPRSPARSRRATAASRPPDVCGSKHSASSASGGHRSPRAGRGTHGCARRRRSARPARPRRAPRRTAGSPAVSSTTRAPLRSAISQPWPARPKPGDVGDGVHAAAPAPAAPRMPPGSAAHARRWPPPCRRPTPRPARCQCRAAWTARARRPGAPHPW